MQDIFRKILTEASKARFINKADLTDEEKDKYIKFFDTHPNLDSLVNWQNPDDITREKLESIYDKTINSAKEKQLSKQKYKRALDEGPKQLFLSRPNDFEIIDENDKFLFVKVLTYEGAQFCDNPECGGQCAKWCIGYEKNDSYWHAYTDTIDPDSLPLEYDDEDDEDEESEIAYDYHNNNMYNNMFILAFSKNIHVPQNQLKYMIRLRLDDMSGEAWRQDDKPSETIPIDDWPSMFGLKCISSEANIKIQNSRRGKYLFGYATSKTISIGNITVDAPDLKVTKFDKENLIPDDIDIIGPAAFKNAVFEKEVIIPPSVKIIDNNAFEKATFKKGLQLSEGLEKIDFKAFTQANLSEIIIPQTVVSIGMTAFSEATIQKVTLPKNSNKSEYAFERCPELKEVVITGDTTLLKNSNSLRKFYNRIGHNIKLSLADTSRYEIKDGILIDKTDMAYLAPAEYLENPDIKISSLDLPPYIKSLRPICDLSKNVTELYIPDGIESIGEEAFTFTSLEHVRLPNTLKTIGAWAFGDNNELKGMLEIPESVTSIGDCAFNSCIKLLIFVNNGLDMSNACYEGRLFKGKISDYELVDGVLYNKNDMLVYYMAVSSKNLIIPDGVKGFKFKVDKSIYNYTNKSAPAMRYVESIILPESFVLQDSDFYNFTALKFISLPATATIIPPNCFAHCASLEQIHIPDSVKRISKGAFLGCLSLKNIILPDGLSIIESFAFSEMYLDSISLPKSLSYLEPLAFCSSNINSISYNGTIEDFNKITIFNESNKSIVKEEVVIKCLDGNKTIKYSY